MRWCLPVLVHSENWNCAVGKVRSASKGGISAFLSLAQHHTDDILEAKSRFQPSLWHHSLLSALPQGEILWILLTWDQSPVSAPVSGLVLMSSHSREQRGDTLDNRRPTFSLCSIPMSTELSHAQHCNVHIFFLYIMEVRVKVSVQTRFTFNIHVIDPHAWSSFCHFAHLYYEYIRFKFRGHPHCVAMVTNSHGTLQT